MQKDWKKDLKVGFSWAFVRRVKDIDIVYTATILEEKQLEFLVELKFIDFVGDETKIICPFCKNTLKSLNKSLIGFALAKETICKRVVVAEREALHREAYKILKTTNWEALPKELLLSLAKKIKNATRGSRKITQ